MQLHCAPSLLRRRLLLTPAPSSSLWFDVYQNQHCALEMFVARVVCPAACPCVRVPYLACTCVPGCLLHPVRRSLAQHAAAVWATACVQRIKASALQLPVCRRVAAIAALQGSWTPTHPVCTQGVL